MDGHSSSSKSKLNQEKPSQDEYWKLAKKGIQLMINNKSKEAEELFQNHPNNVQMYAGRCFAIFIDALMTFEEEKLNAAYAILRQAEQHCNADVSWIKSMKSRVFGSDMTALALENQIIIADAYICLATLTFLQQDTAGYIKGGWTLRKSWKLYQQAYADVKALYRRVVGEFELAEPEMLTTPMGSGIKSWESSSNETTENEKPIAPILISNGYRIPHSLSDNPLHSSKSFDNNNTHMKQSISHFSSLHQHTNKSFFASFSPYFNLFSSEKKIDIDKETVKRLMGAVAFGYGLFQLGISLLPPSILRVMNFFGFVGDRENGIANLMYARRGQDMRAPLASLALLWYHTIVRPFYCLDGCNITAGVAEATQLLNESEQDYPDSALFLFFRGRVDRLQGDVTSALGHFEASVNNTPQREIKVLSMHEVGWCHLIQRNFTHAQDVFHKLETFSRWSRPFYAYLALVSAGGSSQLTDFNMIREVKTYVENDARVLQLEGFLYRRMRMLPRNEEEMKTADQVFWRLLIYELLYLWNVLPNCSHSDLVTIIEECAHAHVEPMTGLAKLIEGCCFGILKDFNMAHLTLEKCISKRKHSSNNGADAHISAFCQYELASIFLTHQGRKDEGKQLLQHINTYKNYDFEQRLTVRVHLLLKKLATAY